MNLIQELRDRDLLQDVMPETEAAMAKEMVSGYIGFDPTADSLHVGSLVPITLLMRLQQAGHKPFVLVGGATGMIGDPSGKSQERNLLDADTLRHNCNAIRKQLEHFLNFDPALPNCAVMVDNYDWFKDFRFLDFIRDVGKLIPINYMLAKDSVKNRMETGMSFTEFTYQLIQGYDFYHLHAQMGVKLQLGGADQWGNMVTGTEIIRKKGGGDAYAITCKLLTKSDGGKFGKSESGNVWLDRNRTSPYKFFQFWIKQTDDDAERLAYTFSFRPVAEIQALVATHKEAPHQRLLQKTLAEEMTVMVHGIDDYEFAKQASEILFGTSAVAALRTLNEQQLLEVMDGVPQVDGTLDELANGIPLTDFLANTKIVPSKGEARKLIANGGISINKEKATDAATTLSASHLLNGRYVLIQKGKSNYFLCVFG